MQEKLSSFQAELEHQLNFIRLKSELDVIHKNEIQYKTELFQKETEEAVEPSKHNIFEDYSYDLIHGFEEKLKSILQDTKVGGADSVRVNRKTSTLKLVVLRNRFQWEVDSAES